YVPHLADPVRDELGHVRPYLAAIPLLTGAGICAGQALGLRRLCGQCGETRLHDIQPLQERVGVAHRSGINGEPATMRLRSVPSRSTRSSTTSPSLSQGYRSGPFTSDSSRMQPVPHVPEPMTSPVATRVPRD